MIRFFVGIWYSAFVAMQAFAVFHGLAAWGISGWFAVPLAMLIGGVPVIGMISAVLASHAALQWSWTLSLGVYIAAPLLVLWVGALVAALLGFIARALGVQQPRIS